MHKCRIDGNGLIWSNVRTVLEVVVLPFLLTFKVEAGKTTQVFLANSFVNSRTSSDSLTVIVGSVGPPVGLGFDIP